MTLNVYANENIPGVEEYLGDAGRVTRFSGREIAAVDLQHADALLVRSVTRVDAALLSSTRVQFVGSATSGVDHIDQAFLSSAGIEFAHAPGSNANSVVEYVLAAVAHDADRLEQLLAGGSVGIIGYGHVGTLLASRLEAMDIAYQVYDPWQQRSAALDSVLGCDVVSLHCELTDAQPWPSRHLINAESLAHMRNGALLINASRGSVVAQSDLLHELGSGRLQVVLDVWENEPCIDQALLQRLLIGTAHIAGYSADGKALATQMLCAALATQFQLDDLPGNSFLPQLPPIELAQPVSGAALVRTLLRSRYDITQDDASLRNRASDIDASKHFDSLRKHYAVRRELFGSTVLSSSLSVNDVALVKALGCSVAARPAD